LAVAVCGYAGGINMTEGKKGRRPPFWEGSAMTMPRKHRTRGIDNVLVDLGFDDAEELSVKAMLAMKLNALLESQGLTQARASKILGLPQPKISAIRNYKLRGISLERLMQALTLLGQHVRIVVSPSKGRSMARIDVAA